MLLAHVIAALAGLGLLAVASDRFVTGSSGLARKWGLSAVLVGAVVVGFGTSAPELLVSALAAGQGRSEIGIGNIVGSNLANVTLILGLTACVAPFFVRSAILRREVPLAALSVAAFAVAVQNGLTRPEGAVLAALLVVVLVTIARNQTGSAELRLNTDEHLGTVNARLGLLTLTGLAGTIAGAQALVWGATGVADAAGLSGGFVGMTLVAVGTSLPEMVTAVQAARKGEHDLIVGNLLGSNIFNSLGVGAVVGVIGPQVIHDASLTVSSVALMGAAVAASSLLLVRGRKLTRGEGIALLVGYSAVVPLLA